MTSGKTRITLVGSTGLIGKQFLELAMVEADADITAITRRDIPGLKDSSQVRQVINSFEELESLRPHLKADVFVCSLGTTIKMAGSQERFYTVDHDFPLTMAKIAKEEGCGKMILVSSVGADAKSKIFYSRVKGELEGDLAALNFDTLHILRPGMLLGDRQESRPGEFIGKLIMAPLGFMFPWKYKPIEAHRLASTILHLCKKEQAGFYIHEGRSLFSPE